MMLAVAPEAEATILVAATSEAGEMAEEVIVAVVVEMEVEAEVAEVAEVVVEEGEAASLLSRAIYGRRKLGG